MKELESDFETIHVPEELDLDISKFLEERRSEQSDLNWDGVPMNENDAVDMWRGWSKSFDIIIERIENIGVSLPDMFMVYRSIVIFQEAKVRRGNFVHTKRFQWSQSNRMAGYLHPWQLIWVVYNGGMFDLYEFRDIQKNKAAIMPMSGWAQGRIKVDISLFKPFLSVFNEKEFNIYLDIVHAKAFKKPRRPELQIEHT